MHIAYYMICIYLIEQYTNNNKMAVNEYKYIIYIGIQLLDLFPLNILLYIRHYLIVLVHSS